MDGQCRIRRDSIKIRGARMIKSLKQVMLYVEKFNDTVEFFTEDLGFVVLELNQ